MATSCASGCGRSASTATTPGGCTARCARSRRPGSCSSAWQSSAGGPDRRTYELTRAGEERLLEAVAELQAMHHVLDRFLLRCADTAGVDGPHRMPYGPS